MVAIRSGATDPRRSEIVYRDLGLSFIPHPVTKNINVLKNEEAIKAYEPRAIVKGVELISEIDNNAIKINIVFSINNSPVPSQLTFTVERVR